MDTTMHSDVYTFDESDSVPRLRLTSTPNRTGLTCSRMSCNNERQKNLQLQETNTKLSQHIATLLDENISLKAENAQLKKHVGEISKCRSNRILVSKECQKAVRSVYNNLCRTTADFGYTTDENAGSGFFHPLNQIVDIIVRETRSVFGPDQFKESEIREASKTFYKSIKDRASRVSKGTIRKHQQQSKRSRIMRKKCLRRQHALQNVSIWTDATKREVEKTLSLNYISSEEELEYPPSPFKAAGHVRAVREMTWKSQQLTSRHHYLDKVYWEKCASPKEKAARTVVLHGQQIYSERSAPKNILSWAAAISDS